MNPNEQVVKAADSTMFFENNPVKGKLILTTQRVCFKPEANSKPHNDFEIYPADIADVMLYNERLLFSRGLTIINKSGNQSKFLVKNRESWSKMIVGMV